MPLIRKRIMVEEWVIISPERAARPRQLGLQLSPLEDEFCPFCPKNKEVTPPTIQQWASPSFPNSPWGVRSIANKFPALRVEEGTPQPSDDLYQNLDGVGAHEVIIESPEHDVDWHTLPVEHLAHVFGAWRDRMNDLRGDRRLRCALVFKNHGAVSGATLEHVHSQLVAMPLVPPTLTRELNGARSYHQQTGRCAICDMMERELHSGERLVLENEHALAIAPYGSRVPFEVWVMPRRHQADFTHASAAQLHGLAELTSKTLALWEKALGPTSFNFVLHSLPFDFNNETYYHWHLELIPRTGQIAGFEWGANIYINATASEVAARHLRNLI